MRNPRLAAIDRNQSMWQLEMAAMNASSGSTPAGSHIGSGTTCGDAEAGTDSPPSNVQTCARLYRLSVKTSPFLCQLTVAVYSAIDSPPDCRVLDTGPRY